MKYILDELQKSMKYHVRQLEENLRKIKTYEEAMEDLKKRNKEHKDAILEIGHYVADLEYKQHQEQARE